MVGGETETKANVYDSTGTSVHQHSSFLCLEMLIWRSYIEEESIETKQM